MIQDVKAAIENGNTSLGIELGSTRIKAVLIAEDYMPIALGTHDWENSYIDQIWTYSIDEVWKGVQDSFRNLAKDVKDRYGVTLSKVGSVGISGMMHGYMPFDKEGDLLVPFRTWRNNMTEQAATELTELFQHNIPYRWSIAHLYQAILNHEKHISEINYITTLSAYIHWKLTGKKVIGVGEASGMFPIDLKTHHFNENMLNRFNELVTPKQLPWKIEDILPEVLVAGEEAGILTEEGAKLLDISGHLEAGIPLCPPEGDAGTGMVATNSIAKRKGNVSAGTSAFAMVVLEKGLKKVYTDIDLVTTPSGNFVAMAHSNNCTSDLNAWLSLFREFASEIGTNLDDNELFNTLFNKALEGDADAGGLLSFGYLSGEHVTRFEEGRPLFVRSSESNFTLANFIRTHIYASFGAMKIGMDILLNEEGVKLDEILGHGGIFKTKGVAQSFLAAAFNVPVSVMETADEGGAWGIALLAAYMREKAQDETLEDFLNNKIFGDQSVTTLLPKEEDVKGFKSFMQRYRNGLPIERAAVDQLE